LNIAYIDKAVSDASVIRHKELIGRAGEAGFKVVVIHPSSEPIPNGDRPLLLNRCAENLGVLIERAKEFGMQVAVEDLPRTCLCNCKEDVQFLLSQNEDLRVCFDTNHLLKDTNEAFVRAVGDKIITLHVSDYDFIDEKHVFPGDGLNDWKGLMGELEKVNYNGPFLYEVSQKNVPGRSTLEDIRANHLWLNTL
jgi:sugar phosphate isomerase/epimerase